MTRLVSNSWALAFLGLFALPVQAQIYKCPGAAGGTVIQQMPCVGGSKLDVRPASGYDQPRAAESTPVAPEHADATGAASRPEPMTNAQRIEANTQASIRERERREMEQRTVPRARAAIYQHRGQCARTLDALASDQYAYKQNLYGKTHAAQRASEQASVAAECETQDRTLVTNFNTLLDQCRALDGCAGIKP